MLKKPAQAAGLAANKPGAPHAPQVPLQADAAIVTTSGIAFRQFQRRVSYILSRNLPLSIVISNLGRGRGAAEAFGQVCAGLAACAADFDRTGRRIEIVVAANALLPQEAWSIRSAELGAGPVHLLASAAEMRVGPDDKGRFLQFWEQLWQRHADGYLRVASAATVRSSCDLLPHESGTTVLPGSAIQAPVGTAWIVQQLDLPRYADTNGLLDRARLRRDLRRAIEDTLAAHEHSEWPNACMRHDSWLNRRLALCITGIGDLVVRRRQDPRALACLANLRATLRWIRATLLHLSREAALAREVLPALSQFDPAQRANGDRDRWRQRWTEAIAANAIASRNLLVLSPWSVFPLRSETDPMFLNLVPLLDFADTCAFPEGPQLNGWNINDFIQLHQRMWAVLERRCAPQRFAEQV